MSLKDRLGLATPPLFLMDGSAFIFRGFFANRNMQRSDGFPTNALVVVSRVLLRILREEAPEHFVFVQDGRGKNFRHEIFPLYKANREATPEDLVRQIDPIQRMVRALGLRLLVSEGCEADDCIASLAERFSAQCPVVIVSGDKDLKQCLGPNVFMWDPGSREEKLVSAEDFVRETGVQPSQWADVQALIGDTSDNIPGVPGIGPKKAQQIFESCASLEEIRDHFERVPAKLQEKLRDHLENMFTWRELTTLRRDFCTDISLDDMAVRPPDAEACASLSAEFELFALRREMDALLRGNRARGASPAAAGAPQAARTGEGDLAADDAAPARTKGSQQLSLLDMAAPAPEKLPPLFRTAAELPAPAGARLALIWAQGEDAPPHLAVAAADAPDDMPPWTGRWAGEPDELADYLAQAALVVSDDAKRLWRRGLLREGGKPRIMDLGIAAYLLNPEENDYGWPRLAVRWGAGLPRRDSAAALALDMARLLENRLLRDGLLALYENLEIPLAPVLARMEAAGIAIDGRAFGRFLADVQKELDELTGAVYAAAGRTFNIRSAQQLGEVLYGEMGLPAPRKTRGGQASTSQETLERLAGRHPVVESILHFRKLEKMRSTYLDPLPRLVDGSGRLHTTFNQKATATGRLSSSNPNLQNIPVRGPLGKRMRTCFVAGEGRLLVSADYSQVELRVLAHMSQDAALLDAFRHGEDIHARTAALIYDCPQQAVTPDQRRNAKTINFGLIYGMGAQKLAQELKITTNEAKEFIARYFERLTGLKAFYDEVEAMARRQGFVTTLGGRRRLLPDIHSANGQASALARRQAINTVIQGSAADIIKLAMLAVDADADLRRMQARLLLQVHDELLLEVPQEAAQEAAARVTELMSGVAPGGSALSVPLLVDAGTGRDWGAAH